MTVSEVLQIVVVVPIKSIYEDIKIDFFKYVPKDKYRELDYR